MLTPDEREDEDFLTPKIPVLNFDFSDCDVEVDEGGMIHAVPNGDIKKHSLKGCKCGPQEMKIGDAVIAIVHKAWDTRNLIESLFMAETPEEANAIRKEYMEESNALLKRGDIDKKTYFDKWFLFEDTFETLFRAN